MKFKGTKEEAQFVGRLVNAYSAAQSTVEQLRSVLCMLGLIKENGRLDQDKVMAVISKAIESNDGG